jgi:hypothetical protein
MMMVYLLCVLIYTIILLQFTILNNIHGVVHKFAPAYYSLRITYTIYIRFCIYDAEKVYRYIVEVKP